MRKFVRLINLLVFAFAVSVSSAAESTLPTTTIDTRNSVERRLKIRFNKPDTRWKWWDILAPILVLPGIAVFAVGVVLLLSKHQTGSVKALQKIIRDTDALPPVPGDPEVTFVFHTYQGLFISIGQTEHNLRLPATKALYMLKHLHYFNLKWGWLCRGGLFVPFLSIGNYLAQKSNIRAQLLTLSREQSKKLT